jgi:threonine synthase
VIAGNPFLRYRRLLESYALARSRGVTDADFVALVERLDAAVAKVDGRGFAVTPLAPQPELASALGGGFELWVKDETHNVSGSHKGRHLFGLMLDLSVRGLVVHGSGELAIASCGNAALAAAVVARAVERPLRVFIPADANAAVVTRLGTLGARIEVCERRPGEIGDPCYLRFREAIDRGATAFSVQGTDAAATIDGGRTIAWELAEQMCDANAAGSSPGPVRLDEVFVQVGGGALAAAVGRGMRDAVAAGWLVAEPALYAVQTASAHPLERAWRNLLARTPGADHDERIAYARAHRDELMWAWENVAPSMAHGILDDVTYDWLDVADAMDRTGGAPIVVSEAQLAEANALAGAHTTITADPTGTAGLAGLIARAGLANVASSAAADDRRVAILFTGVRRTGL